MSKTCIKNEEDYEKAQKLIERLLSKTINKDEADLLVDLIEAVEKYEFSNPPW